MSLARADLKALFKSVGGTPGLQKILTDFYERMTKDLMIGFFFEGKDIVKIVNKQRDFLLKAMGQLDQYTGLPPAVAHKNLAPILKGHFDRRLKILEETLRDYALTDKDIRTWIAFESAFRNTIVSR